MATITTQQIKAFAEKHNIRGKDLADFVVFLERMENGGDREELITEFSEKVYEHAGAYEKSFYRLHYENIANWCELLIKSIPQEQ